MAGVKRRVSQQFMRDRCVSFSSSCAPSTGCTSLSHARPSLVLGHGIHLRKFYDEAKHASPHLRAEPPTPMQTEARSAVRLVLYATLLLTGLYTLSSALLGVLPTAAVGGTPLAAVIGQALNSSTLTVRWQRERAVRADGAQRGQRQRRWASWPALRLPCDVNLGRAPAGRFAKLPWRARVTRASACRDIVTLDGPPHVLAYR